LGVVRTYSIVGQCRRTAATATNKQFCVIAALPSFENICYFCPLVARRKVSVSRYHAKLLARCTQAGESAVDNKVEN